MRVGILGSGLMGGKLGTIFARAGHEVTFSYARSEEKLKRPCTGSEGKRAGGYAAGGSAGGRGTGGSALVANERRVEAGRRLVGQGRRNLLPADEFPEHRAGPGHHVVRLRGAGKDGAECSCRLCTQHRTQRGAFRRVRSQGNDGRPSLVYCGDDSSSKEIAAELIRDVGFDPVDAGPLRIARYTEPFALLVGQLAYEGNGGPELAYRFEFSPTRDRSAPLRTVGRGTAEAAFVGSDGASVRSAEKVYAAVF